MTVCSARPRRAWRPGERLGYPRGATSSCCDGPADYRGVRCRGESGRHGPSLFLVRRGRNHFGVLQSFAGPVVADVAQRRRGARPVLRAHARLVPDFPAHGVLVAGTERPGGRRRCSGGCGARQTVLFSHSRSDIRSGLRDLAPNDVGGRGSSPVCHVDDGRRVADGAARRHRTPRQPMALAVLRCRASDVSRARPLPRAVALGPLRFHLCLPAHATGRDAVRNDVCARGSGCRTVPGQGCRASASDQLGRADRAANDRGSVRCSSTSSEAQCSRSCRHWS